MMLQVVDTTGAGDCYTGAYAVATLEGLDSSEALKFSGKSSLRHLQLCYVSIYTCRCPS